MCGEDNFLEDRREQKIERVNENLDRGVENNSGDSQKNIMEFPYEE